MVLAIPKEIQAMFKEKGFKPDPQNPYKRESGEIQHRFFVKDEKGHILNEFWLNEAVEEVKA